MKRSRERSLGSDITCVEDRRFARRSRSFMAGAAESAGSSQALLTAVESSVRRGETATLQALVPVQDAANAL